MNTIESLLKRCQYVMQYYEGFNHFKGENILITDIDEDPIGQRVTTVGKTYKVYTDDGSTIPYIIDDEDQLKNNHNPHYFDNILASLFSC